MKEKVTSRKNLSLLKTNKRLMLSCEATTDTHVFHWTLEARSCKNFKTRVVPPAEEDDDVTGRSAT